MKCLSAVSLKQIIPSFVSENIGEKYTKSTLPDMMKTYNESSSTTPIAFILGETADPCEEIYQLSEKMNLGSKRLQFMCLGRGKEKQAADLLREGVQAGTWVVLENCHLVPHWLPTLESICESFDEEIASPDFRLFMSSATTNKFPVPILQNCIKVVLEEPLTVRENLQRLHLFSKDEKTKYNEHGEIYQKLLLSFSMFHAVLNERVYFKEVGWNQEYVFSKKNLMLCLSYLLHSIKEKEAINLKAISYLTSECIYGSEMEDYLDNRTLLTIFQKFSCLDIISDEEKNFDDYYNIKAHGKFEQLLEYVNTLPDQTSRHLLGMPEALDSCRRIEDTNKLLTNLMLTQNISHPSRVLTDTRLVIQRVDHLISILPACFDLAEISRSQTDERHTSLNIILCQEVTSCNRLISYVRQAMASLKEALIGVNVMSSDVEKTFDHVKRNVVLEEFKVSRRNCSI